MSYFIYSFFIFFISRWSAMCLKGKTTKYIHIFIISIGVSGPENNLSFFFSCSRSEKKRKRAKKSVGRLVWGVIRSSTFSNVRCLLQAGRLNKNLAAALFFSGSISCLRFISKWVLAGNVALQVYIELLIILCFVVVSRPAVTCSGLQQLAVLNHPFVKKKQKKNRSRRCWKSCPNRRRPVSAVHPHKHQTPATCCPAVRPCGRFEKQLVEVMCSRRKRHINDRGFSLHPHAYPLAESCKWCAARGLSAPTSRGAGYRDGGFGR